MNFFNSDWVLPLIYVAVFALQLVLCFCLRSVILRLIPTILSALATAAFAVLLFVTGESLEVLGYLILMIAAGGGFAADLLAWLVFGIARLIRRLRRRRTQIG